MKKRLNFIKFFIVASLLIVAGTSCNKADTEIELSGNSVTATDSTEVGTSTEPTKAPTQATEIATEDEESVEKQIILDIYAHFWRNPEFSDELSEHDYPIMNKVDKLSNRYLGSITSEEDAIEKGKSALEEMGYGYDDNRPYETKFNDEYGVWVVKATLPAPCVDDNGTHYATIGTVPYIVIRQSDGKALGTFVR